MASDLVPPLGLEPRTAGLKVRCANQLRQEGKTALKCGAIWARQPKLVAYVDRCKPHMPNIAR